MISIAEKLAFAIALNPRRSAEGTGLAASVPLFFSELRNQDVPHALVGAMAMLQYIEARNGPYIELIADVTRLSDHLAVEVIPNDTQRRRVRFGDLHVDVFDARQPFFASLLRQHSSIRDFAEGQIPCTTLNGLLLYCLYRLPSLYRSGRFDLASLCETTSGCCCSNSRDL